jgi:hypothetical protein
MTWQWTLKPFASLPPSGELATRRVGTTLTSFRDIKPRLKSRLPVESSASPPGVNLGRQRVSHWAKLLAECKYRALKAMIVLNEAEVLRRGQLQQ